MGGNSRFPRKRNNAVTIWHTLSTGQVSPVGGHAKKRQRKDAPSAHLPVLENFWPTKHTNDTKGDIRRRRIGDFIHGQAASYFLFLISSRFAACPPWRGVS
jgi:hypothetical protein